jgi:HAD superfamily hydrolase (TIGR01509 family)
MLTVLWDNDGVLVDTEGLFFEATRDVLRTVGAELTPEMFIDFALRSGESTFRLAAERGIGTTEIARLRAERDQRYAEFLQTRPVIIEGVREALASLHGRVGMGVVTSSRRVHFDLAHAQSGLRDFFRFVLAREDYVQAKPDPEPYLTAVRRFGLQPEDCLVVEDSERGLAAATAAGLRCIAVPTRWTRGSNFGNAYKVLDHIAAAACEIRAEAASHLP